MSQEKKQAKIAVLVSGGGTNLQALIDAQNAGIITSGRIEVVISNKADAYALTRAKDAGIEALAIVRKNFATKKDFEDAVLKELEARNIDLIILAGFLLVLSADFVNRYPMRIINIHPALIPSFCGDGYYGLKVHEAVLAYGVKLTGATVHYVTAETDGGPIILQKAVAVRTNDTPESLQLRVMKQAEWKLLPKAAEMVSRQIIKEA